MGLSNSIRPVLTEFDDGENNIVSLIHEEGLDVLLIDQKGNYLNPDPKKCNDVQDQND